MPAAQNHRRRAITALNRAGLHEGLLNRIGFAINADALKGDNVAAFNIQCYGSAAACGFAINQYSTGAALAIVTTEFDTEISCST